MIHLLAIVASLYGCVQPEGDASKAIPPPDSQAASTADTSTPPADTGDSAISEPWVVYASSAIAFEDWVEPEGLGTGAAFMDIDLDGTLEVVLAGGQNVWAFAPTPDDTLLTTQDAIYKIPFEGGPSLSTADFNGDGHEDLLTSGGSTPQNVTIVLHFAPLGSGTATLNSDGFGHQPVAFDADNDGHLDVVHVQGAEIAFFYGPFIAGEVREPETLLRFEGPDAVSPDWLVPADDLNGDGSPDLIITDYFKRHVLPGPIFRGIVGKTRGLYLISNGGVSIPVAIAQVDSAGTAGVWVWRLNPDDDFTLPTLVKAPVIDSDWELFAKIEGDGRKTSNGVGVGDVTGDGLPDFMGQHLYAGNEWRMYEGGIAGPVDGLDGARLRIMMEGELGDRVRAADIDGNGVPDYLTYASTKAMLFMNPPLRPR